MFTLKQGIEMDRDESNFKCTVCANAYNSRRDGGGLAFEDLPESWKCPVCDQPKACTKYDEPTDVGGHDENNGQDENFKNEDSWAECQEHDAEDWQNRTCDATVGHLGLMREIRPADTGKGPDNDGRHLGPNGGWNGGWSKPNPPCIV